MDPLKSVSFVLGILATLLFLAVLLITGLIVRGHVAAECNRDGFTYAPSGDKYECKKVVAK